MSKAIVAYTAVIYGDHRYELEVAVYEDNLIAITASEDDIKLIIPKEMALALSSALTRVVSLNTDILT